jgi:Secretion system C-terminal sorting domain/SprB repeat
MKTKLFLVGILTFFVGMLSSNAQNCDGFKTFTIGGWGTECNGGNPGCYRDANFDAAFPDGVIIGCGSNTLSLTSSSAVQNFLPSGSTPRALDNGNLVNPGQSYSNVLAAQLVGVTLAVGFDTYDPNFSSNSQSFASLFITQGPFTGMTVGNFLQLANQAIGGCVTGYSFSELNDAATAINENYDNGTTDNGFLNCVDFRIYSIVVDSDVTCYGYLNGQVTVTVTGGVAPFVYTLSNSQTSGSVPTSSYTFTGLGAGNYTVTVTDSNGFTATGNTTFTVTQPSQIVVATASTDVSCFGGSNGTASISSITGGQSPYAVVWFNGSTDYTLTGLSAGTYTGVVTDNLGCTMPFSVTVGQPEPLAASSSITNVTCYGGTNGSATVTASGGTAPYSILWANGSTNFTLSNLMAGTYSAVVTDANGCQIPVSVTVNQPLALSISITKADVLCYGGTANATATVSGGTPDYTYSWNTNPVQTSPTASLPVGTWTVTVTDANGCSSTATVTMVLQSCQGFTTITQGGYGAKCSGNNWGCYLKNNFAAAFPSGLTVGSGTRLLRFTSASAIQAFLPSSTTPRALNVGTMINPTNYKNVLAGQTVALTLSLGFDANANFSSSSIPLGSLIVTNGTFSGMTVNQLLSIANTILGGGSSPYTASQINDAIDRVNRNYDNGTVNLGYLACPCSDENESKFANSNTPSNETLYTIYPNPVRDSSTLEFSLNYNSSVKISMYTISGQLVNVVYENKVTSNEMNSIELNGSSLESGIYLLKIETDREVRNKTFVVAK